MILHVTAGSSWWLFAAATLILFLHIAGGTVGIISGAVALLSRKGGRLHRIAGTVFLVSMLIMALALRARVRALAVDGLLAGPRSTHAMVQESEIPTSEDPPALFPVNRG